MFTRRCFLSAALALTMAAGVIAPASASQLTAPVFVERLADKAIATAADKTLAEPDRMERFRQLFVSSFDLPEIGKFVLGRHWRTASPQQQQEFLKLFEEMTVLTWAQRFKDYSGERLVVSGTSPDGDLGVVVDSRIERPAGQPIPVQWRLRQPEGDFKVVDIVVEGVSMAITQRQEYASAIQGSGGRLDGLLAAMRKKIAAMKGA